MMTFLVEITTQRQERGEDLSLVGDRFMDVLVSVDLGVVDPDVSAVLSEGLLTLHMVLPAPGPAEAVSIGQWVAERAAEKAGEHFDVVSVSARRLEQVLA